MQAHPFLLPKPCRQRRRLATFDNQPPFVKESHAPQGRDDVSQRFSNHNDSRQVQGNTQEPIQGFSCKDETQTTAHLAAQVTQMPITKSLSRKSDLVVVLDLDECLIHSRFFSKGGTEIAPHPPHLYLPGECCETFQFTLQNAYMGDHVHVHATKRPFLHGFLERVSSCFETHVFTSARQVYAEPILDELERTGNFFARRHFRESCHLRNGEYIKDLRFLNKPPERLVLIDNSLSSFSMNPFNGILVPSFYNDPNDKTLLTVHKLLKELDQAPDVRPLLDKKFGLRRRLEEMISTTLNE